MALTRSPQERYTRFARPNPQYAQYHQLVDDPAEGSTPWLAPPSAGMQVWVAHINLARLHCTTWS